MGGTSKTAYAVAKASGAFEIVKASRSASGVSVLYEDVYKYHTDAQIIINTTPVGMYPNIFGKPIDLSKFGKLSGVIDAVYNPLNTPLILEAKKLGIPAEGGLFMLVAQAVRASEHFLGTRYDDSICDEIYSKIEKEKKNIVLIGMPASGKSTVGRLIAKELGREVFDTDELIEKKAMKSIPEIFTDNSEEFFRNLESEVISEISQISGSVIATGGGAILREKNVDALRENGILCFIDRPLEKLIPTIDRPTASTAEQIKERYYERINIYRGCADITVDASEDATAVAKAIINKFNSL
jgi:shikimate dehydrogenase